MKKLLSLAVLGAAIIAAPTAFADTIASSISFNLNNVAGNQGAAATDFTNPATYQTISWASSTNTFGTTPAAVTSSNGTGVFVGYITTGIPLATGSSQILYTTSGNGGTTGNPFKLVIQDFNGNVIGNFTENRAPIIFTSTSNGGTNGGSSLTAYLNGTFTFQGALSGNAPQSGLVTLSFTATSNSVSGSGTLATPGQFGLAPEPSSLVLLGTGLVGGVGAFRRRFKA